MSAFDTGFGFEEMAIRCYFKLPGCTLLKKRASQQYHVCRSCSRSTTATWVVTS